MNEFSSEVKKFGPLGKGEGLLDEKELELKLEAAVRLVPYIRLVLTKRLRVRFSTMEEYADFYAGDEANRLFQELIADRLVMTEILMLLRENPRSVGEIAHILSLAPSDVSRILNSSVRQKFVGFSQTRNCFMCC